MLLCTVSLLGAVGGAAGIFALTETDLYNKTVDQLYADRIQSEGQTLAYNTAMFYASRDLGGCPVSLVRELYDHDNGLNPFYYGYALKDAEGNVLMNQELPSGDAYRTYTFDVTGQYMYLVDTISFSEQIAEEAPLPTQSGLEAGAVLCDAIPDEGAAVYEYQIATASSSVGSSGDSGAFVFRNQNGQVIFRDPGLTVEPVMDHESVTSITLRGIDGEILYDAAWHSGIGFIRSEAEGGVTFFSYPAAEPVPATTAEETVPMTTAPAETVAATEVTEAAEETLPAETGAEKEAEEATEATAAEEAEAETKAQEAEPEATEAEEASATEETAAEAETTAEETGAASAEAEAAPAKEDAEAEPAAEGTEAAEETVAPTVPETTPEETLPEQTLPEETVPEETEPVLINGKPLSAYQINRIEYYDHELGETATARYVYVPMPEMTLELYIAPGALRYESSYTVLGLVKSVSRYLLPAIGICLLIFAVCAVYLCCAAGKKPKSDEIRAGGLNRIPLDLYGFSVCVGVAGLCVAIAEGGDYMLRQNVMVGCAFIAAMAFLACLLIVGFLFAFVAQIKTPGGFWWRNSLVGWCLKLGLWLFKKALQLCVRMEQWVNAKGWPLLVRLFKWLWNLIVSVLRWFWNLLIRCYHKLYNGFNRFLSLLPVTWQWLLLGMAMVFFLFITVAGRFDFGIVLAILFAFALVIYGAHCFGVLLETTKKMNKGDLDSKVDDKLMIGAFKEFAGDLNDLAGVAVVAAQKQLKSERMKTELITNVSHDIKTPLTSIINYVDLLQKPHTEDEQEQYLEVLDRQSQRLKKLIDDLMDMSKASTGNMAVDITLVDAVESVNQALGEFADKLDRAQLTPVFRHTEDTVAMMADGRLVWRVLSNLLSNAVKYAMPGTRLYIDLMSLENKVVISLKNISRDELNVDAEELMERFVRGDDSRNTEGSGLGLNIAKSLMELQKGQLQLLVDGDLFKVTLIFPGL